jgi:hypothetical protein
MTERERGPFTFSWKFFLISAPDRAKKGHRNSRFFLSPALHVSVFKRFSLPLALMLVFMKFNHRHHSSDDTKSFSALAQKRRRRERKRERSRNERTSSFNHRYVKNGNSCRRIICHNNDVKFVFFCLVPPPSTSHNLCDTIKIREK